MRPPLVPHLLERILYGLSFPTMQALLFGLLCLDDRWILIPDTVRSCYEAYTIYSFYNFIEGAPAFRFVRFPS